MDSVKQRLVGASCPEPDAKKIEQHLRGTPGTVINAILDFLIAEAKKIGPQVFADFLAWLDSHQPIPPAPPAP